MKFTSVQRRIADFVTVRRAMGGEDLALDDDRNGILGHVEVRNRANFLVPPREHRALPSPSPGTGGRTG